MADEEVKPKSVDRFLKLKHIGYSWSQNALGSPTFKDFVKYAQFQLCVLNKVLMKDPIWDEYTEEEILAEYFAHGFQNNSDYRKEFEISLATGEVLDFSSWADLEMKRNQEAEDAKTAAQEDSVQFSPDDVMGER
jgi:hypothetical protein